MSQGRSIGRRRRSPKGESGLLQYADRQRILRRPRAS